MLVLIDHMTHLFQIGMKCMNFASADGAQD